MHEVSKVEEVARGLRAEILAGVLRPRTRLREEDLAARFGVSRNTLREAFRGLVRSGLVEHRPHRGATVAEPSPEELREVYRLRRILEPAGLSELTPEGLGRLDAAATAMDEAAARDDWPAVGGLDIRFHAEFIRPMRSPRLDRFFRSLLSTLRLAFITLDRAHARRAPPAHVAEHRQIVDALARERRDEARRLLDRHLDAAEKLLVARMERGDG